MHRLFWKYAHISVVKKNKSIFSVGRRGDELLALHTAPVLMLLCSQTAKGLTASCC